MHNHERHALSQLENLRQTDSGAEYKAPHDVLAAQTNLPMQLRLSWWERGLKDVTRTMCLVDPLTHREYTDIAKAQSAACAVDAYLTSAYDVATANDLAATEHDDGLRVSKRPRVTNSRHQHYRCYNCGSYGHTANACPGQYEWQDVPTEDDFGRLDANGSPADAADGEE